MTRTFANEDQERLIKIILDMTEAFYSVLDYTPEKMVFMDSFHDSAVKLAMEIAGSKGALEMAKWLLRKAEDETSYIEPDEDAD